MSIPDESSTASSAQFPLPADVLRWIAVATPQAWFASEFAAQENLDRATFDEPLWLLRQSGLITVADWVKGRGQGFKLTEQGEDVAKNPPPAFLKADLSPVIPQLSLQEIPAHAAGSGTSSSTVAPQVISQHNPPPAVVAPAFLVANVIWFLLGIVVAWRMNISVDDYLKGDAPGVSEVLLRMGAITGTKILLGDYWRLLSCSFVHLGLFHLLGNMVMLGILGPVAEGLWGRRRFAVLYLIAALGGSTAGIALHPIAESGKEVREVLLAGASGALWGILVGMIAWLIKNRQTLNPELVTEWIRRLVLVIIMNLLISFAPGVSIEGHLGGGFAGLIAILLLDRVRTGVSRRTMVLSLIGLICLILFQPIFLWASMRYNEDWHALRERHQAKLQEKRWLELQSVHAAANVAWVRMKAAITLDMRNKKVNENAELALKQLEEELQRANSLAKKSDPQHDKVQAYLQSTQEFLLRAKQLQSPVRAEQIDALSHGWEALEAHWNDLFLK